MPLLAPFERKSTSVIDIESRSFRKKQQGRLKKHIGDLCLLAGLPQEALTAYNSALENLRVRHGFFIIESRSIFSNSKLNVDSSSNTNAK